MAFAAPILAGVSTLAGGSAGLTTLATAAKVGSAVLGGVSAIGAARTQSAIAAQQAKIAEQNAQRARQRAQVEQQEQDLLARAALGELRSRQASSGLDFGSGSFASRRKSAEVLARKDALNIRQGGELEAQGFEQQAADARFEAKQDRRSGLFSAIGAGFDVGTSLIGGASSVNKLRANRVGRSSPFLNVGFASGADRRFIR